MKRDSRLSTVLHGLLHMAQADMAMTSDVLAACMGTNPVVVRRNMGLLRKAGIVSSTKGHSGGWRIVADLDTITLRDLHDALGEPAVFAIGIRNAQTECLVEQAVNAALDETLTEAEALLLRRFETITLGQLAEDFSTRFAGRHPPGR
ncbi:RrF2 family transcriptional regulator [Pseudooceanicola aestuarii]|uniref:RrF2 family transcriptional regulator n=1 Tax=Pseudooceanicola aestuarii TaxID=2697319 RepID=UPI0013D8D7B0|nr:Rrf2 family transcriptional regulator [Pseudooceanicola aestuarii]